VLLLAAEKIGDGLLFLFRRGGGKGEKGNASSSSKKEKKSFRKKSLVLFSLSKKGGRGRCTLFQEEKGEKEKGERRSEDKARTAITTGGRAAPCPPLFEEGKIREGEPALQTEGGNYLFSKKGKSF